MGLQSPDRCGGRKLQHGPGFASGHGMKAATPTPAAPASASTKAERLLGEHHRSVDAIPGTSLADAAGRLAATATALMDLFRETGSREVFDCLMQLVGPQLYARVRARSRFLGLQLDAHEVLQDVFINIYLYPDRFLACRPGAFAAWSSTIVDNTIRRQLRRRRSQHTVSLSPVEILSQQPDRHTPEPACQAEAEEDCLQVLKAMQLLLRFYLLAFAQLSERERFVLQMVEVRGLRYAELAAMLAIRPEALKMVVFRARKRVHDRMAQLLAGGAKPPMAAPAVAVAC